MRIGLIPMSAKPYHAGHDGLVRLAANECDSVQLFVSLTDRKRPGELVIRGKDMEVIWKKYIEKSLPGNVLPPIYCVGSSPVQKMYQLLNSAEKDGSDDTFVIYSDEEDILTYTDSALMKYMPTMFANGQVERRRVNRNETINVSGTKMRQFISLGDITSFSEFLPVALRPHSQEIFGLLSGQTTNENLIKKYVKMMVSR